MPISAQQWRLAVGKMNANKRCPAKSQKSNPVTHCARSPQKPSAREERREYVANILTVLYTYFLALRSLVFDLFGSERRETEGSTKKVKEKGKMQKLLVMLLRLLLFVTALLLLMGGDVERNPGPPKRDIINVINSLSGILTDTISLDLSYFSAKFVESGFVTQTATTDILTKQGIGNREKAYQLLNLVTTNYKIAPHKQEWFDKFVAVFSSQAAYEGLVLMLTEEPYPPGEAIPGPTRDSNPPACIKEYSDILKQYYNQLTVLPDDVVPWPPPVAKSDTQIILIEHASVPANSRADTFSFMPPVGTGMCVIQYEDIFTCDGGSKLTVLIDGAPGVGKTTLCKRIAQNWSKGVVPALNHYQIVLLVHLREVSDAQDVDDLFNLYVDHKTTCRNVIEIVKQNSGKQIMLLLDGFDELPPNLRSESVFANLIQGKTLVNCAIVVTSRPYATQDLQSLRCFSRHVGVQGFAPNQIKDCIYEAFPGEVIKAARLMEDLERREDILSLCQVPMNCAIIIAVYKGEECCLPLRVTELYKMFLTHALRRHIKKNKLAIEFNTLEDLQGDLQSSVDTLAKIAYDFLIADKLVFSKRDLLSKSGSQDEIHMMIMGLVTAFNGASGFGPTQHFQFLHLTIQEFLAAWHALTLSSEEQAGIIGNFTNERLKLMRFFLAGLSKLKDPIVCKALNSIEWNFCTGLEVDVCNNLVFADHLHMIYESQNSELCRCISDNVESRVLRLKHFPKSPLTYRLLSFFLLHSMCAWEHVDFSELDWNISLFNLFNDKVEPPTSVKGLTLFDGIMRVRKSNITLDCLTLISKIPIFKSLENLTIAALPLKCLEANHSLKEMLEMRQLKILSFIELPYLNSYEYQSLNTHELGKLLEDAPALSDTLQDLNLSLSSFDYKTMRFLGEGLEKSKVKTLQLCLNSIEHSLDDKIDRVPEGIAFVMPYIIKMKYLESLSITLLRSSHLLFSVDDELSQLRALLEPTITLKKLELCISPATHSDMEYICSGLEVNTSISSLVIAGDLTFDLHILKSIFCALRTNKILQTLHVVRSSSYAKVEKKCDIERTWIAFSNFLVGNTVLQEIILYDVQREAVQSFATSCSHLTNLKTVLLQWTHELQIDTCINLLRNLSCACPTLNSLTLNGLLSPIATGEPGHLSLKEESAELANLPNYFLQHTLLQKVSNFNFFSGLYDKNEYMTVIPYFGDSVPLLLDPHASFALPLLSPTSLPQDSCLLHNDSIDIECCQLPIVLALFRFELHLHPIPDHELPSFLHRLPISIESVQELVSVETVKRELEKMLTPGDTQECWVYIGVQIRIMESDHITVQNSMTWLKDVVYERCPFFLGQGQTFSPSFPHHNIFDNSNDYPFLRL